MTGGLPVKRTWSESQRFVPRTMVQPLQRVLQHEAAGGLVMLAAAVLAIVWANSPWSQSYFDFWSTPLRIELGELIHLDHLTLQAWVNDALMTVFFLLVGLEIKREAVHGDLRDLRGRPPGRCRARRHGRAGRHLRRRHRRRTGSNGWGIPMATDIAFAVGVVSLLGTRVPLAAKVFLLTLAVADDIGAILVIAIFYTERPRGRLARGGGGLLSPSSVMLRRGDVQALAPYLAVGAITWFALLESGVHATLAGVALGLLTPAWPLHSPRRYPERGSPARRSDRSGVLRPCA